MYFSETVVVYDMKVVRCIQQNEYMNLCLFQRSKPSIDLGPRSLRLNMDKICFS